MEEEFDMDTEQYADEMIECLNENLHAEHSFITVVDELVTKLDGLTYVIMHLQESLPAEMTHLHTLNNELNDILVDISEFLKKQKIRLLHLYEEEQKTEEKISSDKKHKNFSMLKEHHKDAVDESERMVKINKYELKWLHSHFIKAMKAVKGNKLHDEIAQDFVKPKLKEEYEQTEHHYFV